jgi:hypothetical protein
VWSISRVHLKFCKNSANLSPAPSPGLSRAGRACPVVPLLIHRWLQFVYDRLTALTHNHQNLAKLRCDSVARCGVLMQRFFGGAVFELSPPGMWPYDRASKSGPIVHVLNGDYPEADLRRMSLPPARAPRLESRPVHSGGRRREDRLQTEVVAQRARLHASDRSGPEQRARNQAGLQTADRQLLPVLQAARPRREPRQEAPPPAPAPAAQAPQAAPRLALQDTVPRLLPAQRQARQALRATRSPDAGGGRQADRLHQHTLLVGRGATDGGAGTPPHHRRPQAEAAGAQRVVHQQGGPEGGRGRVRSLHLQRAAPFPHLQDAQEAAPPQEAVAARRGLLGALLHAPHRQPPEARFGQGEK